MIQVFIADDHQIFLDGLTALLNAQNDIECVGQAVNGQQVLDYFKDNTADVVLMDIRMPVMDGIQATERLKQHYPEVKVIVLSMHSDEEFITELISKGADGYLLKDTDINEMVDAIHRVSQGKKAFADQISDIIINGIKEKKTKKATLDKIALTRMEKEVLDLLSQELTTAEIASHMHRSPYTIESHRANLIKKFEVKSTVGLIKKAIELDMLTV